MVNLLGIEQPQRLELVLQPGRGQPGDRQCRVRPHHHQTSFIIGDLKHELLGNAGFPLGKYIIIFQTGSDHLVKAAGLKHVGQQLFNIPIGQAFFKKKVPGSLRRNFTIFFHKLKLSKKKVIQPRRFICANRFSVLL